MITSASLENPNLLGNNGTQTSFSPISNACVKTKAHSSVERAGLISMLRLKPIQSNERHEMTGEALEKSVLEDINNGLIPFFVSFD